MTRESFARWICNTCGLQEETDPSKQPKRWVGYGFTDPDLPAGEHKVLGHLCGECAGHVSNALKGSD